MFQITHLFVLLRCASERFRSGAPRVSLSEQDRTLESFPAHSYLSLLVCFRTRFHVELSRLLQRERQDSTKLQDFLEGADKKSVNKIAWDTFRGTKFDCDTVTPHSVRRFQRDALRSATLHCVRQRRILFGNVASRSATPFHRILPQRCIAFGNVRQRCIAFGE